RVGEILPGTRDSLHVRLPTQNAFGADLAGHTGDLGGERVQLVHHGVNRVLELQDLAAHVDRHLLAQIAVGNRRGDFRDVADLACEVSGPPVDGVGQILPGARDPLHLGLTAQFAFGADLEGHAGDLGGEGVELVHHGVDGVLELEDFAANVHGHLL